MMLPQSLQLGASCWKRIGGAPARVFGASASRAGMTKPIDGTADEDALADCATDSMNETSFAVGFDTFAAGSAGTSTTSRLITPASSWLSRLRNLIASHLKM